MGFEYRLNFSDPRWYQANRDRLADQIRALPRFKSEPTPGELWLKDDDNVQNSWPYDLRIFLRRAGVDLEDSVGTATMRVDVPAIVAWIRQQTPVDLVDDDGIPISPG